MNTSDFDYDLPPEYIAQTPVEPRDASRLLVLHRETGVIEHSVFRELGRFLHPGDLLVLNETRVIPARLYARKSTGGRVEILLLRREDQHTWEVLVGGKGLAEGKRLRLENGPQAEILTVLEGGRRRVHFDEPIEPYLPRAGHVPLPPYIHTPLADPERYQTVYARQSGSAAAPTAGLHFTPGLITRLQLEGIRFASVTLHVGLDTFAPVTEDNPQEHFIHTEWCQVPPATAEAVNQAKRDGKRVIAVGTTSVRTLESATKTVTSNRYSVISDQCSLISDPYAVISAFEGPTSLYILPGYKFRVVDAIVTNFHLPRSTLIMLVSAFAGCERILDSYEVAKREGYRFYSFGDAMLLI